MKKTSTATSGSLTGPNSGRAPSPWRVTSQNATLRVPAPSSLGAASGCLPSSRSPAAQLYWRQTTTRPPSTSPSTTPARTCTWNPIRPFSTGANRIQGVSGSSTSFSPPTFSTNARTPLPSLTSYRNSSRQAARRSSPTPAVTKRRSSWRPWRTWDSRMRRKRLGSSRAREG